MQRLTYAAIAIALATLPVKAEELTVATAGDQNMVDYINQYLGPLFEKANPGDTVRAVGTGPGDSGSQKILERFDAQAAADSKTWDIDVAVVHEKFVGPMVQKGYLDKYRNDIATGKLVSREQRRKRARLECRRLRHADVQQPDGDRLQSGARAKPAEELRGTGRMGQGPPEAVRLQRHQGRRFGRQLRHGLGLCLRRRRCQQPDDGSIQARRDDEVGRRLQEPCRLHQERDADTWQCRHAGPPQPRRDRHGPGLGRHVLLLAGQRPAAA
jgi:hypothetical protein